MRKLLPALALVFVIAASSRSQSASDFSAKYPVVTSYEIRPGVLMTPRYTAEGQVCEIQFERQRGTRSGVWLDSSMSDKLVLSIVDELAPPAERGKPIGANPNGSAYIVSMGQSREALYRFENINYEVAEGNFNHEKVVRIAWNNRKCKPEPEPLPLSEYPH